MAEEELHVVRLRNDFYQDGFKKIVRALAAILFACAALLILSVYIFLHKPAPVIFYVDNEWRILPDVPLDQPYVNTPDLIQWVSNVLPAAFTLDFINYTDELKRTMQYFTANGWKKFTDQLNLYASISLVQNAKLFVNGAALGAPFILNQGLLAGKYSWWIQMPLKVNFNGIEKAYSHSFDIQVLVQRMSTLDNLLGLTIENIIVINKAGGNRVGTNG